MGLVGGLLEAGRQLHWGAGSLAWEQGVAGLRGIGSCLGVMQRVWHTCEVHSHTHNIYKMRAPKRFGSTAWPAGGPGWDRLGVRLAQLRGEQAPNTNQGDLVMDIGLTERALCWVVRLDQLLLSHASRIFSAVG